ncbi:uroporphyrinogen-III synthase [Ramlibacter albus]|uniref:Uroporphyrinogen-III synthase n=1 Tax=Ramlibacter albus TaxID=2079448 RepID=A0A923S5T6_9BURK|nr:uroporphyrinogen-III synthase [Ramlibacter albus]MBC5768353.1 uroporphyrinogen-III synthase [Ramlibacter albus]
MLAVVTRPVHEAGQWVERLRGAGIDAVALPLIDIGDVPDGGALRDAWSRIGSFAAVMFVSGNAVRGFFRARPHGATFTSRAWAPGPGTRDALVEAGLAGQRIDLPAADAEQFDSEALWAQVQEQARAGSRVLIVRGGDGDAEGRGRDWLAQQLERQGVAVETVASYVRAAPRWSQLECEQALALARSGVWLFSSSQAIANLRNLLPQADWSGARAVATHPRIAQAARECGFGAVLESRPAFDAVVAALESFA